MDGVFLVPDGPGPGNLPVIMPNGEKSEPAPPPIMEEFTHWWVTTNYLVFHAQNGKVWISTMFYLAPNIELVTKFIPDYEIKLNKRDEQDA